ncbi:MAG: hypothetical protein ACRDQZ_09100 [Mycobacteriales bacterium]
MNRKKRNELVLRVFDALEKFEHGQPFTAEEVLAVAAAIEDYFDEQPKCPENI